MNQINNTLIKMTLREGEKLKHGMDKKMGHMISEQIKPNDKMFRKGVTIAVQLYITCKNTRRIYS